MSVKNILVALAMSALSGAVPTPQVQVDTVGIVGGTTAAEGDFPYIVSLQQSGSHFCGGSLVNANTVVSAAHCAVGQSASSIRVRAGSLNRGSGGTLVRVSSILVNPGYDRETQDGDVAIFKLATAIPESSTIAYAALPAADFEPSAGTVLTTAGWGTTSEGGQSLPAALRKVDVPVVDRAQCKADYKGAVIPDSQFCAGYAQGGKDSCQGDSGGPIADKAKTLLGIVSWGEGCAEAGKPGVYTDVGKVLSFITKNM